MLATTQRLRRSSDFAAVVRGGRRAGRGSVVVHLSTPAGPTDRQPTDPQPTGSETPDPYRLDEPASAGSSDSPARAGFVVSKAVGNAVVRNTVRRRLRHLVRDRLTGLPPGTMLVVRALPAAAGTPSQELGADLDAALAAARTSRRGRRAGVGVP